MAKKHEPKVEVPYAVEYDLALPKSEWERITEEHQVMLQKRAMFLRNMNAMTKDERIEMHKNLFGEKK